jgi:ketosteroid isomerase-like protein
MTDDLTTQTVALLKRDAEFAAAASAGNDVEAVLSYWSADAVVAPPGQPPIVGRAALRQYVQDSYQIPGFNITWEATADPEFSPDLRMAYLWGRNSVTFSDPEGNSITVHGRAVTIWRREDDDEWRCAVDMWQDDPTP